MLQLFIFKQLQLNFSADYDTYKANGAPFAVAEIV